MNPITLTEDEIISVGTTAMQGKLRPLESLPGAMSLQVLKKIAPNAPAAYVAFLGTRTAAYGDSFVNTTAVFTLYVITNHAHDAAARQRGDARQIGAYDILNTLVPALHGHTVPDVGSLRHKQIQNLFSVELDKQGVSIYAATFEIDMAFTHQADDSALDAFVTYHAEHSMTPGDDEPAAVDEITLDQ